jgi:hypothetical protein
MGLMITADEAACDPAGAGQIRDIFAAEAAGAERLMPAWLHVVGVVLRPGRARAGRHRQAFEWHVSLRSGNVRR